MKITYYHLSRVDSTNSYARRIAANLQEGELVVITADTQTGGYGRLHRSWISPEGTSLACTFLFFENNLPLFAFSQLASLACLDTLAPLRSHIKWPNDILIDGKKVTGILIEMTFIGDKRAVIVGIGMNVNVPQEILLKIPRKTTSLHLETGKEHSIQELQNKLVEHFQKGLTTPLAEIQTRWGVEVAWMQDTWATIQTSHDKVEGVIQKLCLDGTLEVRLQDGRLKTVHSGDITS